MKREIMSDFLFELGVEEVPVSEINKVIEQLKDKLKSALSENRIDFTVMEAAATNKRFMIYIRDINPKANDSEEEVKGPSKSIAFDADNQPTIALKKFLESNNAKVEDLVEIEKKNKIYMTITKKTEGENTPSVLKRIIPEILSGLKFAKTMVWNTSRVPFVRPLRNLLALFDNQLIKLEFAGIQSSNLVKGHTLLSDNMIKVNSFKDYCELLNKNFVIVREDERRQKILEEIKEIEDEYKVKVRLNDKMLEDFIFNNEYPVVFLGKFDKKYLSLPTEIISTFMINEKKLLPVADNNNNLINIFVGVSSIPDENRNVCRGNEKVIRATFEDAAFFWDNDRKDNFFDLREKLKSVNLHQNLGNLYDKTERMVKISEFLLREIKKEELGESIKKAAKLCKNDLVTRMVREFPSLQGVMGGLYLKEFNTEPDIWNSVYWHYEPKGFNKTELPHLGGGILSLVDKIDNITGFISKGIKISSSKDPYGIRRDANAIIKTIIDFNLDFDLNSLIEFTVPFFSDGDEKNLRKLKETITNLFLLRTENILKDFMKIRYDIVNSVLNSSNLNIFRLFLRTRSVLKIVESDSIQILNPLHKRFKNIIKDHEMYSISDDLLIEQEEKVLYEIFKESKSSIEKLISENNYLQACSKILEMKPLIDNFFDKVLINADDKNIRENRIALLQKLENLLSKIATFSIIIE
jgi:glycyl-tRNA synthetase beta chain